VTQRSGYGSFPPSTLYAAGVCQCYQLNIKQLHQVVLHCCSISDSIIIIISAEAKFPTWRCRYHTNFSQPARMVSRLTGTSINRVTDGPWSYQPQSTGVAQSTVGHSCLPTQSYHFWQRNVAKHGIYPSVTLVIHAYTAQDSEKSSIITNRKSTMCFPMSKMNVVPACKPPKEVSKTQSDRFCRFSLGISKKVCYKVALCENCLRQSCKAFTGLSIRAQIVGGGHPLP